MARESRSRPKWGRLQSGDMSALGPHFHSRFTFNLSSHHPCRPSSCWRNPNASVWLASLLIAFGSILVMALAASATTSRSDPEVVIRGLITDTSGKALVGATIILQTFDGQITATTSTDRTFQFAFELSGRGELIIVVNKRGYNTAALKVPANRRASLLITMEPECPDGAAGGGM